MGHDDVRRWVDAYERVWREGGGVEELFTEDATYLVSPWAEPVAGRADIATFWQADPDRDFTMSSEVVAVEGETAVVRVAVSYAEGHDWRDLWVLHLDADGRCRHFEEWPFAPRQPDGHEADGPPGA